MLYECLVSPTRYNKGVVSLIKNQRELFTVGSKPSWDFTPVAKPKATCQSRDCSPLGWATAVQNACITLTL